MVARLAGFAIGVVAVLGLLASAGGRARAEETEALTPIHAFAGVPDGAHPGAGLVFANGRLYALTRDGGAHGAGAVVELLPSEAAFGAPARAQVIYSFGAAPGDGRQPAGELLGTWRGELFGVTQGGGAGFGTVFRLVPPGPGEMNWRETQVYVFKGGADGAAPSGGVVFDRVGRLYGTTSRAEGEACNRTGCGTVFRLTPVAGRDLPWRKTVLHRFAGAPEDGATPSGSLLIEDGALYGMTQFGGARDRGSVFRLGPPGPGVADWTLALLHSFFGGGDGANPASGLVADADGQLYGVARHGGDTHVLTLGGGVVFALGPGTFRIIYTFNGTADGAHPTGRLTLGPFGTLYGATEGDADGTLGSVFALTPPGSSDGPWVERALHAFTGGVDGGGARGPLARVGRALYGAAPFGGTAGEGTAFAIRP